MGYWPDDEVEELDRFFPTLYSIESLDELPGLGSPRELDLIISAASDSPRFDIAGRYSCCHLILFGTRAWGYETAPSSDLHQHYQATRACESQGYHLGELPGILAVPLQETFPDSAKDFPLIEIFQRNYPAGVVEWRDRSSWIAWGLDPELPLAIIAEHGDSRGLAWFPTPPVNRLDWIRVLVIAWAEKDREAFASVVPWAEDPEWMTSEEVELDTQLKNLEESFKSITENYEKKKSLLQSNLLSARHIADRQERAVLRSQDEELVNAVVYILRDLGFDVESVDENTPKGVPRVEDLRIRDPQRDGWEAIVEVKGHRKRGPNAEDLQKIDKHARRYRETKGKYPDAKIYITNNRFELPPEMRDRPYASHPGMARGFCEDEWCPGIIIASPDLFRLHRDRKKLGLEQVRQLLVGTPGIIQYPAPGQSA